MNSTLPALSENEPGPSRAPFVPAVAAPGRPTGRSSAPFRARRSGEEEEILGLFVQESRENLAKLEAGLVALGKGDRDPDCLHRLFRAVHSVKGAAGFFGFTAITSLAHVMESVLALVRDDRMEVTPALVHDLLAGTDQLLTMLANPKSASEGTGSSVRTALQGRLQFQPAPVAASAPIMPADLNAFNLDPELIRAALRDGQHLYIVQLHLQADIEAAGQTPLHYLREVSSLGTLIDTALDLGQVGGLEDDTPADLVCSILFATAMEPDLLLGAFGLPSSQLTQVPTGFFKTWITSQPTLVPWVTRTPAEPEKSPGTLANSPATHLKPTETVRLPVSLIGDLQNLVGALGQNRDALVRLAAAESRPPVGWAAAVQQLDALTTQLQHTVARARYQPLGTLFVRYVRLLHELGQTLGKEIRLETSGGELEVDRTALEGLADPLTHLIRNSADHGIERPVERLRLGKPVAGLVSLRARLVEGWLHLEVADDGRGLDHALIATQAVEKNLLTPEQAAALSPVERRQMIFAPGFSTATAITDISGRGYGLDVVKTNLSQLGGEVGLESTLGQGTTVILRLPAHQLGNIVPVSSA